MAAPSLANESPPVLLIPGLKNSGPEHWQSYWERQYPQLFRRVEQDNWQEPEREAWVMRLGEIAGSGMPGNLVLVGHSVGCATILHAVHRYGWKLKGALLVAPSDVDHPNYPTYIKNFSPMPLQRLPFPTIVVASDTDHVVSLQRATDFATAWGSRLVVVPAAGHFLPKDGFGPWPEGLPLLQELGVAL